MQYVETTSMYNALKSYDAEIFFNYNRAIVEYNEFCILRNKYTNYILYGSYDERTEAINNKDQINIDINNCICIIQEYENILENSSIDNKIANKSRFPLVNHGSDNGCSILWYLLLDIMNESILLATNFEKIKLTTKKEKILTKYNDYWFTHHFINDDNKSIYENLKNGAINNNVLNKQNNIYDELLSFIFYYMDKSSLLVNLFSRFGEVAIFSLAWTCYFYCYCCAKSTNYEQIKSREMDIIIMNKCINSLKSEGYRISVTKDKNRENGSRKKLKIKSAENWTKLKEILRKHGKEIYIQGDTLNEVAKKIGTAWGKTYEGKIPDPQTTIKRLLNNFAGINTRNIAQISDLINTLRM